MEAIIKKYFVQNSSGILIQVVRYSITGGLSAFVDVSLFTLLANIMHVNYLASNILAFVAGLFVNYMVAREWVFNSARSQQNSKTDFAFYAFIGVLGLALSNLLLYVLIDIKVMYGVISLVLPPVGDEEVKFASKITTVLIVFIWNFIMRRKLFSIKGREGKLA